MFFSNTKQKRHSMPLPKWLLPVADHQSPCCVERERAHKQSFFTRAKSAPELAISVKLVNRRRAWSETIVGGRHVPYEKDELATQKQLRHQWFVLPSIREDEHCEDCHAFYSQMHPEDICVVVSAIHDARSVPLERHVGRPKRPSSATATGRKPLPLLLNRMPRPSKNGFANFPRRDAVLHESPRP
ncbi:Aste57867_113 [Aphanomyces stellatus]|uniref:Aste57867_113 protein n=1 Tax=Aphanomyces stellatus TaxID=120398 RepID=A0A485K312_9STRA|nr:hypothetical protein As57867_000113 [Aphanomyces stellatus]VFT77339.1 Aste57867_113 [Aphanomyces stellatus]